MDHPVGWIIAASPALAHRPNLLSLPLNYAALLIMTCLFLGLTLQYPAAAVYLFAVGWSLGKLVTCYDVYAWELTARNLRVPRLLRA